MSIKSDLAKVKRLLKPKTEIRIIRDRSESSDIPGVIWVLFTI